MKQEKFGDLFELVTGNLHGIAAWHSRLIKEVKELENRESLGKDKTLQEISERLIEQEKLLKKFSYQRRAIQFKIEQNSLPWLLKKRIIIPWLKEFGWDDRDKIKTIFQGWDDCLLSLEKQLSDLNYFFFKSEELNEIIQEKLLEQFGEYNQNNEDDCDKIEAARKAYELLAEYSAVQQKQSANRDGLGYVERLQALKNKLLEVGGVSR